PPAPRPSSSSKSRSRSRPVLRASGGADRCARPPAGCCRARRIGSCRAGSGAEAAAPRLLSFSARCAPPPRLARDAKELRLCEVLGRGTDCSESKLRFRCDVDQRLVAVGLAENPEHRELTRGG